ncbi:MAG: hypothetical protein COT89_02860 [Candidatus Colwellbacteria bacterium CG10_big_fil_rev_8_21_14_0_10_42_22]|uniref:Amidohydrolase-related domain-containing protein n=1 Tax=Candidatus Colwellbacteria bacterium CG10_big_fil_rev_8_21_14_0_10_42_22 TaxID=1974540 RepID=A0A2H0VFC5_9BACT|nr:MAG: hypothetical protein COT89_02860 [Candidatus Colwellbacteria bacterium CG10_big_fil_rev_8_21_14_0_10_42_22]
MSLLIKGVQVIDGTGKEPYKADVLVQGGLISSIGNLKERGAGKIIEGLGNYLVPGFIDIQSHSDHYLSIFSNPKQEVYLKQGVTTILGGVDGSSLAPLLYGSLDSINMWSDISEVNVNWHTTQEFLYEMESRRLGINYGTFAGHSTIRRELVGDRKNLEKKETDVLGRLVSEAIKGGAFGVSADLASAYGNPISLREANVVGNQIADKGSVYVVGLRDIRKGLIKSMQEVIKLAESTGATIVIDNLRPVKGYIKEFREALSLLKESATKLNLYFIIQPSEISEVPIYSFLPDKLKSNNLGVMLAKVRDSKNGEIIKEALKEVDFRNMQVASAPHHHFLVGKTIKQIAENWDINYIEAMQRLMEASDLKATIFYEDINISSIRGYLGEERALVTANATGVSSGGNYIENLTTSNIFPDYLRSVVREGLLSLEGAIKKLTSIPAKIFGIDNRGMIEEGMVADLVLLGKSNYEVKQTILGGRIFGEDEIRGEILRYYT